VSETGRGVASTGKAGGQGGKEGGRDLAAVELLIQMSESSGELCPTLRDAE
jgi:hypothetical protein